MTRNEVPEEEWEVFIELISAYSIVKDKIYLILNEHNFEQDKFLCFIFNHLKFISERGITISLLIQQNLLWDAEIILRSALEATVKILYLCNCNEQEREIRFKEIYTEIPEINSLKHSDEAKKMVKIFGLDENSRITFSPIILDPKKELELKEKWTSKKRKEVLQKWSFTEILREQAKKIENFDEAFLKFSHSYRISSHVLHADEMGMGIIAERLNRSKEDIEIIEKFHFCSIMKTSLDYMLMSGISLSNYLNISTKPFIEIYENLSPTIRKIDKYKEAVLNDPIYDSFR